MTAPLFINPLPHIVLVHFEGVGDVSDQIADQKAVVSVTIILLRMNVADNLVVMPEHHDQWIGEHHGVFGRAATAALKLFDPPKLTACRFVAHWFSLLTVVCALRKHPSPRGEYNVAHCSQVITRCIESFANKEGVETDDRPEGAFTDAVLFSVAVAAQRQRKFIVRLRAHAAVFVVRSRLHPDVSGFTRFIVTAKARELSHHCQIHRIGIADDFQLDPLRYAEGAFE